MIRLLMWIFLIAILISVGPALCQGVMTGLAEGGKGAAAQVGDAAKDWAKEQVEDALPDWVKETKSDAKKVLAVAEKIEQANAKHIAYYQHCLANHAWHESGGRVDASQCFGLADVTDQTACFEAGAYQALTQRYGRAQADDAVQVVITDCAQYLGMSGGIVKAGGSLFGAATEWIRCYWPQLCTNPELENSTYYTCLHDAAVARRINTRQCGAYSSDASQATKWRMCYEVALDKQVAGGMGLLDIHACRDKVTK
jgi:hypothetical protein